jgi:hypothetical protein
MVTVDFALQNPAPCRCDDTPTLIEIRQCASKTASSVLSSSVEIM